MVFEYVGKKNKHHASEMHKEFPIYFCVDMTLKKVEGRMNFTSQIHLFIHSVYQFMNK